VRREAIAEGNVGSKQENNFRVNRSSSLRVVGSSITEEGSKSLVCGEQSFEIPSRD
jgi:hypothetical protein